MNSSANETDLLTATTYPAYDYPSDYPDQMCWKNDTIQVGSIAIPLFYSIVVTLSLIGNTLVIGITLWYENLRSSTNTFILNLALSDLIFTAGLPFWACYLIWGWTSGDTMCKAVSFVFSVGFYSSMLFLTLMTIQRYVAIVRPLTDLRENRPCLARAASILVWVLSASAATPALVYSEVIPDPALNVARLHCEILDIEMRCVMTYMRNIFFLVSFSVIGFCYVNILRKVLKSRTNRRHRTVRLIFVIVVMFFCGWAPYNIVLCLITLSERQVFESRECGISNDLDYARFVCEGLAFSHCCLNPVFYAFIGERFRNHLKGFLQKTF